MGDYQETATVFATSAWDAAADAQGLRAAMKGFGTSESEIVEILCKRSNRQRQTIADVYTKEFGRNLVDDLKNELGGNFESVIVGLMMPTAAYCAKQLHKAMKGAGTDEETLVEVLCSRSQEEVQLISSAYETDYGTPLVDDVKSETSGPILRLLVLALQGVRDERSFNPSKAEEQAQTLYQAGEAKLGTDEDAFVEILSHVGQRQAYVIFEEYKKLSGRTIEQAMQDEISGELLAGLLALAKSLHNRPQYFAERLETAMKGWGTDDTALIRIIVSRCEIDLANIKQEYEKLYGKTLLSAVKSECGGDYQQALSVLIGDA